MSGIGVVALLAGCFSSQLKGGGFSLGGGTMEYSSLENNASITGQFFNVWRWWAMRDSNPRPAVCKTAALTAAPIALFSAALANCKAVLESRHS